jgi:hypothetical protein
MEQNELTTSPETLVHTHCTVVERSIRVPIESYVHSIQRYIVACPGFNQELQDLGLKCMLPA